jgi:hypothetical protein
MEREGKAAGGIVGWQPLILSCVVLCVVCVKERGTETGVSVNSLFIFGNRII